MQKENILIYDPGDGRFREVAPDEVGDAIVAGRVPATQSAGPAKKSMADMGRVDVEHFRAQAKMPVVVVLDNIRSLNNIGSIFRTCDGFACAGIAICGITAAPPSPEIHKTALGAENSVAWQRFDSTLDAVAALREQGYRIVCLEQVHGSVALGDFVPEPGCAYALVVGNEVEGVDPRVVEAADIYIEIPQSGTKHSLNVSVATAVTLWEFYKHSNILGKV